MELDFFIDGTLYDNPINWDEINATIEFDPVNQITTIKHAAEMQFEGDVYNLLYNKYLSADLCDLLSIEIRSRSDNNVTLFNGKISIPKCSFDERERVVSLPIIDDSFGAKIENNKIAKISLNSTKSKNGSDILATGSNITCFRPSDGANIASFRKAFSVHEAFRFLVSWMSDNTVSFRSDFFDVSLGNDGAYDYLISGLDLRTGTGQSIDAPKFSFQQLFDLMRKVRNVGMGFQIDTDGTPIVRIEEIEYFRSNSNTVLLEDVDRTELSFEQNILYTSVKVGSEIIKPNDCSTTCNASNNVSYFGFETEYYSLSGECTNGVELSLTIDDPFIVDTNKIQEVVEFGQDTFDNRTFLIHQNPSNPVESNKTDPLGIGEYWYNEAYTNKEILARYQDYLVGTLSLFNLYSNFNLFLYEGNTPSSPSLLPNQVPSYQTYPSTVGTGIPLNNLIYDPEGSIDTGTERFTPINEGVYKFCVGAAIDEFGSPPPGISVRWYLQIEHYDSGNNLIATYQSDIRSYLTGADPNYETWESDFISMDLGDYVIFNASYAQVGDPSVVGQSRIIIGGSTPDVQYFQCCESYVAIQDAQVNTGQKRQLALTRFDYPIPFNKFQDLYNDTTQQIRITSKGIDRTGYINSLNYNFVKGSAEVQIVSNG